MVDYCLILRMERKSRYRLSSIVKHPTVEKFEIDNCKNAPQKKGAFSYYLELYNSLNYRSAVQFDGVHTALLIFVEIEAKQIAFINMIIVQIFGQLLFSLRVIFIAVPDFQFNDILFSQIVNDHISTSLVTGLCFDISSCPCR